MNKIQGKVKKIFENQTNTNKTYWVVELEDGSRYSVWEKAKRDLIEEGSEVEIEFTMKGDYRNIKSLRKLNATTQPEEVKEELVVEEHFIGEDSSQTAKTTKEYWNNKNERIERQSCHRSASMMLQNEQVTPETKLDLVKKIARDLKKDLDEEW